MTAGFATIVTEVACARKPDRGDLDDRQRRVFNASTSPLTAAVAMGSFTAFALEAQTTDLRQRATVPEVRDD